MLDARNECANVGADKRHRDALKHEEPRHEDLSPAESISVAGV